MHSREDEVSAGNPYMQELDQWDPTHPLLGLPTTSAPLLETGYNGTVSPVPSSIFTQPLSYVLPSMLDDDEELAQDSSADLSTQTTGAELYGPGSPIELGQPSVESQALDAYLGSFVQSPLPDLTDMLPMIPLASPEELLHAQQQSEAKEQEQKESLSQQQADVEQQSIPATIIASSQPSTNGSLAMRVKTRARKASHVIKQEDRQNSDSDDEYTPPPVTKRAKSRKTQVKRPSTPESSKDVDSDDDHDVKLEKSERNKRSAQSYRMRKKLYVTGLESTISSQAAMIERLKAESEAKDEMIANLRQAIQAAALQPTVSVATLRPRQSEHTMSGNSNTSVSGYLQYSSNQVQQSLGSMFNGASLQNGQGQPANVDANFNGHVNLNRAANSNGFGIGRR
jgi:hypothetical protein